MRESESRSVQIGPSGLGLLGLIFVGAKLSHLINWSWIWVLCPFWIGLAIGLCWFIALGVFAFVALCLACLFGDKK